MITRILPFLICLLLFPPVIIWACWKKKLEKRCWKFALFIPALACSLWLAALSINESYSTTADHVKQLTMVFTICLITVGILLALIAGIGRWCRLDRHFKPFLTISLLIVLTVLGTLIYGFAIGPTRLQIRHARYSHSRIPPQFENYKIAFFSDLHLGTLIHQKDFVDRIVNEINRQQADMVVFGGDIVNYRANELEPFAPLLRQIRATDGVVAILGNHDYLDYFQFPSDKAKRAEQDEVVRQMQAFGWTVLLNENKVIERGNDRIVVIGTENSGNRPNFPKRAKLGQASQGISDSDFQILLQHDPSYWRDSVVGQTDIPLTLSGHTHAMQLQMGNWSPAKWFYKEWSGFYMSDSRQVIFVSPGIGEVFVPFRLGAWPELDIITLHHASNR